MNNKFEVRECDTGKLLFSERSLGLAQYRHRELVRLNDAPVCPNCSGPLYAIVGSLESTFKGCCSLRTEYLGSEEVNDGFNGDKLTIFKCYAPMTKETFAVYPGGFYAL